MASKILNEDIIKKFCDEIKDGMPFVYSCHILGLSYNTVNSWMKQGESDMEADIESIECRFYMNVKHAYAVFIKNCKNIIIKGGNNGWQGVAWWLERTNTMFARDNDNGSQNENIVVTTRMHKK